MQASRGVSSGASPERSSRGRSSISFRFLGHLVIPFSTRSATEAISSRDGARPTWKLTTPELKVLAKLVLHVLRKWPVVGLVRVPKEVVEVLSHQAKELTDR